QFRNLMRQADQESRFDLFHGFYLPMAYPCLALAADGGRPVVASIRGTDAVTWIGEPARRAILLPVLRKASWITSVTSDLLANVAPLAPLAGRSSVILNAVDPALYPPWQLAAENRGVVGSVGKFREKKDIPLLVAAYAGLNRALRRRLLLAGFFEDPALEARVMESATGLGVAGEVEITGLLPREQIAGRLTAMHVFVQCSRHDGFPNALLEAAAAGLPLVVTDVGGAREVLRDGESALVVPPGELGPLAAALTAVLSQPELAQRLSQGALAVARTLGPERERAAWLDLYARLLAKDPAGSLAEDTEATEAGDTPDTPI
ncbi:MAG TPA: glycosyltransferase, partial [Thermoanaerobaculia bacterium]|nr:glycosyltransferase [Thermoanaerobaculia bacterium]